MGHTFHLVIQDVEKSPYWKLFDSKFQREIGEYVRVQNVVLPPGSDANPEWPLPVISLAYDSGDEILPLWQETGPEKSTAFIKNFQSLDPFLKWSFSTFKLPVDVHFSVISQRISSSLREISEGVKSEMVPQIADCVSASNLSMLQILKDLPSYSEKRQARLSAALEFFAFDTHFLFSPSKQEARNSLTKKHPQIAEFAQLLFQLICRCMPGSCLDYFISYWGDHTPETKVGLIRSLANGRGFHKFANFASLEADLLPMLKIVLLHTENIKYYKALVTGLVKLNLSELSSVMIELLKHAASHKQYSKFAICLTGLRSLISAHPDLADQLLTSLSQDPLTNLATYKLMLGVHT